MSAMPELDPDAGLFAALLKHWRGQRGLSQLDLALAAEVSARHISFLETGRSTPTAEMVLRLATTLSVPLRQVNALLRAAGHPPAYESSGALPPVVVQALDQLKTHHEPFPLMVLDRCYDIRDLNRGALALFTALMPDVLGRDGPPNLARLTFYPDGAQPLIANFDEVGRALLWRLQREVLADPGDTELRALLDAVRRLPTVAPDWRRVDLGVSSDPALIVRLRHGDAELSFLTMVTAFQAPQNVALDELRIELWFPTDDTTSSACAAWSAAG